MSTIASKDLKYIAQVAWITTFMMRFCTLVALGNFILMQK